jgi:hypothetical protein
MIPYDALRKLFMQANFGPNNARTSTSLHIAGLLQAATMFSGYII